MPSTRTQRAGRAVARPGTADFPGFTCASTTISSKVVRKSFCDSSAGPGQHTVRGWDAASGYDLASGVGTIDAAQFVPELVAAVNGSH